MNAWLVWVRINKMLQNIFLLYVSAQGHVTMSNTFLKPQSMRCYLLYALKSDKSVARLDRSVASTVQVYHRSLIHYYLFYTFWISQNHSECCKEEDKRSNSPLPPMVYSLVYWITQSPWTCGLWIEMSMDGANQKTDPGDNFVQFGTSVLWILWLFYGFYHFKVTWVNWIHVFMTM